VTSRPKSHKSIQFSEIAFSQQSELWNQHWTNCELTKYATWVWWSETNMCCRSGPCWSHCQTSRQSGGVASAVAKMQQGPRTTANKGWVFCRFMERRPRKI